MKERGAKSGGQELRGRLMAQKAEGAAKRTRRLADRFVPRRRRRLLLAPLGVLLSITALVSSAGAFGLGPIDIDFADSSCQGSPLLPDLVAKVPDSLAVVPDPSASSRFLLVFATSVYNAGEGPLRLVGQRTSLAQPEMRVREVVTCAHGGHEIINLPGTMRYEHEPTHRHWHYEDFERYTLRGLSAGMPTRGSRKVGFCLVDDYPVWHGAEGEPSEPFFTEAGNSCAAHDPQALSTEEGISVGWADEYSPLKEGQYVDLTNLPAGEYRLTNQIAETQNSNGVAGVTIRLSWPHGPGGAPTFTSLGTCSGAAACGV